MLGWNMEMWSTDPVHMQLSIICFAATFLLIAKSLIAAPAAERYGVFKTTDRGRSWARSDAGMPGNSRVNAFGALGDSLFAGTDSGVFISRDEGQSWLPPTGVTTTSSRIISFATLGQNVYAGTVDKGILMSSDGGITWRPNLSFKPKKVRCLIGREGKIYAGTDADGVIISTDGGQSWTSLQQGLPAHAQIFAMSMVKGRLFAGLYSKGLCAWSDQEHRWTKVGTVFRRSPLRLSMTRWSRGTIPGEFTGVKIWVQPGPREVPVQSAR